MRPGRELEISRSVSEARPRPLASRYSNTPVFYPSHCSAADSQSQDNGLSRWFGYIIIDHLARARAISCAVGVLDHLWGSPQIFPAVASWAYDIFAKAKTPVAPKPNGQFLLSRTHTTSTRSSNSSCLFLHSTMHFSGIQVRKTGIPLFLRFYPFKRISL